MDPYTSRNGTYAIVDCSDWEDFRFRVRSVLAPHQSSSGIFGSYAFRGQSCSSWSLSSSFDRRWKDLSPKARDDRYERMLRAFRENLTYYGNLGGGRTLDLSGDIDQLPESEIEAIAQHNGLRTRLLDWSQSIYVASFFAYSRISDCESGRVSIFAIDKSGIRKNFSDLHLKYIGNLYKENTRQIWQYGAFTRNYTNIRRMEDIFSSTSEYYDHAIDRSPPLLVRFDIPVDQAQVALDDLKMMRINSMTIFPGLEGVVRWIEDGGYD